MQKMIWFACGLVSGLTALSITKAAVPTHNRMTDDTVIYQELSEIRVPKQGKIDFDQEIKELSLKERNYREKLPTFQSRLMKPMERVSQSKYKYSGRTK